MVDENDRRPLASRSTGWAKAMAQALAETAITPNQISIASMVAAALAAAAFILAAQSVGALRTACLLAAALFIQLRLLCNLLDGMVAVEAGKGTADGPFWNEAPDRVSDIIILVAIGYSIDAVTLGWAAAAFAVLTAYLRELGRASGQVNDFRGPMAKPHRMAILTLVALAAVFEPLWGGNLVLLIGLWLVAVGAAITALRRSARLVKNLNAANNQDNS